MSLKGNIGRLIVAEKPSLARSIASAIGVQPKNLGGFFSAPGNGLVVSWCVGHLLEQAPPNAYDDRYKAWRSEDLPIIPKQWKLLPKRETKEQLDVLLKLMRQAAEIVNAGDPDREGQLLVDEVIELAGVKGRVLRVWLQDLTPEGIRKAFSSLQDNRSFVPLRDAALARSRADWLIGMNLTRAYTLALKAKTGRDDVLHIGRVQTPTLALVVDRDLEIESFVPKDVYTGLARFSHRNGEFVAKWVPPEGAPGIDEAGRVIDAALIGSVMKRVAGKGGVIDACRVEEKREPPPLPYTLSDLQKDAHAYAGLSPQQTLDAAQSLYETHKLTTYPRSDCSYLPENEHANAPRVIAALQSNLKDASFVFPAGIDHSRKSRAWNDKKLGAHHGIVPTAHVADLAKLDKRERAVYELVAKRYLAQFMPDYRYQSTVVDVLVGEDRFRADGQALLEKGWKEILATVERGAAKASGKEKKVDPWGKTDLPAGMKDGDAVKVVDATVKQDKTSPPPRFDGASLIDAMQNAHRYVVDQVLKKKLKDTQGIGTEATRAGIIQNLLDRGYIEERKKSKGKGTEFVSTPKGRFLVDNVNIKIRRVDLTAWFEARLDMVANKKIGIDAVTDEMCRLVSSLMP